MPGSTGSTHTDAEQTMTGEDHGRQADAPQDIPKRGWVDVAKRVFANVKEQHTMLLGAGVAFWAFVSIFPAIIAGITIFGLFLDPDEVSDRVEELFGALPDEAQSLLEGQLDTLAEASGGALGVGLVVALGLALWTASAAMSNLMEAVNVAYGERDERNFLKKKGLALLLTLGGILFAGLALAGIAVVPPLVQAAGLPTAVNIVVWPILAVLFAVGLSMIYRYAPDRADAEWRWVTWGAGIAVVIWAVASIGFQIYVANFGNYQQTYGALAAVVILLFWLLLTSVSVLLGAHVNAELEAQTERDTTVDPDQPMGRRDAYKADHLGEVPGDGDDRQVDLRDREEQQRTEEHVR
jgi:membrane protein